MADKDTPCLSKVCFISDLHFPMMFVNKTRIIEEIVSKRPDVVLIGGDLCHKKEGKEQAFEFLKEMSNALKETKIFVVLGNHDVSDICGNERTLVDKYKKDIESISGNIKVLENESESIKLHGTDMDLKILGLADKNAKNAALKTPEFVDNELKISNDNEKIIVLSHNPDMLLRIEDVVNKYSKKVLFLAGHTHGGQLWLPFRFEFKVLRKDIVPKKGYIYGLYDYTDKIKLYITCGIGCVLLPIRLGTTPEICVVCY